MTGNAIGDEGAKSMSEMMKLNTTLTSLHLGGQEEEGKGNKDKEQEKKRKMDEWQVIRLELREQ